MARPTILLVEDHEDIRDHLALQFHQEGAHVLTAANSDEAYGIFQRRASEVAALVTDVRLDENDPRDRGGLELAEKIADILPNLPLIGVTAYDPSVGAGVLDDVYEKKTPRAKRSIFRFIGSIISRAAAYDEARYADVPETLNRLRVKYGISSRDFATLVSSRRVSDLGRLALLAWHDAQGVVEGEDPEVEDRAAGGGRCLRFLNAGTHVRGSASLRSDVAVVIRSVSEGVIAELYGMPLVFTYGDTEDEAVSALLAHLFDCFKSMGSVDEFIGPNLADVVRFHAFLTGAFSARN